MKNIRVAILDTGIADEMIDDRIKLKIQIYYDYYEERIIINKNATDYNGHGTMCVNTIWERFPYIDIYVVKMLNVSGMANSKVFLEALKYVDTLDVDIVSICASYIIDNVGSEIKEQCNKLIENGKCIIASVKNGYTTSAIANYANVIGVVGGVMDDEEFIFSADADIQMQCSSGVSIVRGVRGMRNTFQGNSRATAIATGILAKALFENQDKNKDISILLEKKATLNEFVEKQYDYKLDDIIYEEFDYKKEQYLVEHDKGYQQFIYLLCEFYMCEDTSEIRTAHLVEYDNGYLFKCLETVLSLIEERFEIELSEIKVEKMQWAYLFYETYLK